VVELFRFRFELDAISDIQPWGEPGCENLHWFGLTSGRYWIETPLGEVLRYTPEIMKLWNLPFNYVDYQVARLFEDLQEHLPASLEAVPQDISAHATDRAWLRHVGSWVDDEACSETEGRRRWALYEAGMSWWWDREIDTGYLTHGPRISVWRTADDVHFRWTTLENEHSGLPVFVVPNGEFTMGLETFKAAVFGFCKKLMAAMHSRLENIRNGGWDRVDCAIDVNRLLAEHQQRNELLSRVECQAIRTDWPGVRDHLRALMLQAGDT
jgi:hypothetical protein